MSAPHRVGVVIITHNRCHDLARTLEKLSEIPERPSVAIVDNGSSDGTMETLSPQYPHYEWIRAGKNLGSAARTLGVRSLDCPLIAFCDDDSWWAPGAFKRAAEIFEAYPRLGLAAARILVGPFERLDPVCQKMQASDLAYPLELPGPGILGFVACGAIVRKEAYLEVGGFHDRYGVGGEEQLLALDLATKNWGLAYVEELVAYHDPSLKRHPAQRRRRQMRNDLWSLWLRRPRGSMIRNTLNRVVSCATDPYAALGVVDAMMGLPWVVRDRRPIDDRLDRQMGLLESPRKTAPFKR